MEFVITQQQTQMCYRTLVCEDIPIVVRIAQFQGQSGVFEYHLMIQPTAYADLLSQSAWILAAYRQTCATLALPENTGVFRRFFCSDLPNQASTLAAQFGEMEASSSVSWVTQPPAPPAKIALWAYHVHDPGTNLDTSKDGVTLSLKRGELTHYWSTGLISPDVDTSRLQTERILAEYEGILHARGLTVADHVQRTWFFVQNLDADYQGLVTARREFFAERGLTSATHYIASTGIEGSSAHVASKVMLDAYAIAGIRPEQIQYLSAPDHLCPTHHYGVTFERGVSIAYSDRKQIFISGTASIDRTGAILHPGDVSRQLDRTLENVAALLQQAGATLQDVGMFILYVRDLSDLARMQQLMAERCGNAPVQIVSAPVCRPGWLVEIECIATVAEENLTLPGF